MTQFTDSLGFTEEELTQEGINPTNTRNTIGNIGDSSGGFIPLHDSTLTTQNISVDQAQVHELCRTSLDFLAATALPDVYEYEFPPVFISVWVWLLTYVHKTRDFSKLALGLPRGFGKTLVIKLFILYAILFTDKKFILFFCENQKKANNILEDVESILNQLNIKKIFGDWNLGIETDRLDLKKFGYRGRTVILYPMGSEGGARGITLDNERPDLIIFDDIQSRECADSDTQSNTLERWMIGTAMKTKSPHGCLFLFVANMYPTKHSILKKLKNNPEWTKFIAGGILADGTSLWEELQPLEQLLSEFRSDLSMGHPEIFYAEVLNDENAKLNNLVDFSNLPPLPYSQLEGSRDIHAGNFIIIDPATNKINSDEVAIGYFELYNGLPVLREVEHDRMSPGECIRRTLSIAINRNCRLVAIEGVAYQSTLAYWFNFICRQMQITGIEPVEVYPGGFSKNSRILEMFKSYSKGEIFVADECKPEVHIEMMEFNPLRRDNTDNILDLLTYAHKVIELYGEFIVQGLQMQIQEIGKIKVRRAGSNSPF